ASPKRSAASSPPRASNTATRAPCSRSRRTNPVPSRPSPPVTTTILPPRSKRDMAASASRRIEEVAYLAHRPLTAWGARPIPGEPHHVAMRAGDHDRQAHDGETPGIVDVVSDERHAPQIEAARRDNLFQPRSLVLAARDAVDL